MQPNIRSIVFYVFVDWTCLPCDTLFTTKPRLTALKKSSQKRITPLLILYPDHLRLRERPASGSVN